MSVKDSRMVFNGQSHAQLVLESGRMWVAVVCPSLPAPPLQNVLVQAVIQLPLQRLVREMHTDARVHLRGAGLVSGH